MLKLLVVSTDPSAGSQSHAPLVRSLSREGGGRGSFKVRLWQQEAQPLGQDERVPGLCWCEPSGRPCGLKRTCF